MMTSKTSLKPFIDPVCRMSVDPKSASIHTVYEGTQFYFCSQECLEKFETAPEKYSLRKKKGFWRRYLDKLERAAQNRQPVSC
jgi:YHS domain-containing protein